MSRAVYEQQLLLPCLCSLFFTACWKIKRALDLDPSSGVVVCARRQPGANITGPRNVCGSSRKFIFSWGNPIGFSIHYRQLQECCSLPLEIHRRASTYQCGRNFWFGSQSGKRMVALMFVQCNRLGYQVVSYVHYTEKLSFLVSWGGQGLLLSWEHRCARFAFQHPLWYLSPLNMEAMPCHCCSCPWFIMVVPFDCADLNFV